MKDFICNLCEQEREGNISKASVIICHSCVEQLMWTNANKVFALANKLEGQGKKEISKVLKKHFTDESSKHYRRAKYITTIPQNRTETAILA